MNLLLLEEADFIAPDRVRVEGRRGRQLREVIRLQPGESCKAGLLNGLVGEAELLSSEGEVQILSPHLHSPPPPPLDVMLVAALPRPKSFRKVLHAGASMGVKKFYFIASWKVEKSYWQSPFITPEAVAEELRLALEQSGDTVLPLVEFRNRFKPFVEDELPGVCKGGVLLAGHPGAVAKVPAGEARRQRVMLAVGPEGGFTPYETELLAAAGARLVSLGPRILRTEFAVAALLAQLGGA